MASVYRSRLVPGTRTGRRDGSAIQNPQVLSVIRRPDNATTSRETGQPTKQAGDGLSRRDRRARARADKGAVGGRTTGRRRGPDPCGMIELVDDERRGRAWWLE